MVEKNGKEIYFFCLYILTYALMENIWPLFDSEELIPDSFTESDYPHEYSPYTFLRAQIDEDCFLG